MKQEFCPICHHPICSPSSRHSDLLIIGDAPDEESLQNNRPFSTHTQYITPGKVLRKELELVGLSPADFGMTYLWQHEPTKSEECFKAGYDAVLDIAKGKRAILLVGADVVSTFTDYKVSNVSGLLVDSAVLSAKVIMATVSPSLALSRSLGEVRFAIGRWKFYLEQEGLI